MFASEQYKSQVDSLRKRFVERESSGYIFNRTLLNKVPADDLEVFMKMIWVRGGVNYNFFSLNGSFNRKKSSSTSVSTFLASMNFLHELCVTGYLGHCWRDTNPRLRLNLPFSMKDESSTNLAYICETGNLNFLVNFGANYVFHFLC